MYPYMTLLFCNTEVTYSDAYYLNGIRCIDVYIERATDDSLINVNIQMPFCNILSSDGMDANEINRWLEFTKKNFTLINEFSMRNDKKAYRKKV